METILPMFSEFGIPGLIIGYLVWGTTKKDERINALVDRLVEKSTEDVEQFTKVTLTLERILTLIQDRGK